MADVTVGIGIDMSDVARALAKLPSMTSEEAEKAVRELTRTFDKAASEAKKLNAAIEKSDGLKSLEEGAGRSGAAFAKLRGILSSVNPALGDLAGTANDAADGFEVLGGGIGLLSPATIALTAAIGAGAVAYQAYQESVAKAEKALADQKVEAEQVLAIQREMADAVLKLAYVRGELTDREYAAMSAAQKADDLFRVRKQALIEQINQEQGAVDDLTAKLTAHAGAEADAIARGDALASVYYRQAAGVGAAGVGTEATTDAIEEHRARLAALADTLGQTVEAEGTYASTLAQIDEEEGKAKASTASLTEDILAQARAAQAAADAFAAKLRAIEDSEKKAMEVVASSADYQRGEVEKLGIARDEQIDRFVEAAKAGAMSEEEIARGKAEIVANYEAQITDAIENEVQKRQDAIDDLNARTQAAIEEQARLAEGVIGNLGSVAGAISDLIGQTYENRASVVEELQARLEDSDAHLTDAQRDELEKQIAAQKDAATRAWEAQQKAKMAEAALLLIMAEMQAASSAPWPYNLGAVAAATAMGTARIVALGSAEPPSFHTGTLGDGMGQPIAPDEYRATLQRGEPVLTRQARAVLGDETIRAANAGKAAPAASGPTPAYLVYRHQGWDRIWRDAARLPGPLRDALTAGDRVGLRGRGRR